MTREEKINAIIADTDKNYAPYYDVIPELIRKNNFKTGIEIGVFCGGHAVKLAQTGIDLLVGIDPYETYTPGMPGLESQEDYDLLYAIVKQRLKDVDSGNCDSLYRHYRCSSDNAFIQMKFSGIIYDFVFIDGLHTYEQLTRDLDNYSQIIRSCGVIACHDYNHPFFPDLTTAIDEFAAKHNKTIVIGPLHLIYMLW